MPSKSPNRIPFTPVEKRILQQILLDPNVCGYGFGARRKGGRWRREQCICFYVRTKFTPDEIHRRRRYLKSLPEWLGEYSTDVLEIGDVRANMIGHTDMFASDHSVCHAAALAVTSTGPALALLPGHAALPKGKLPGPLTVEGNTGTVLAGTFGGPYDWAVARLDVPGAQVNLLDLHTGFATPLAPASAIAIGEKVGFHSPSRGKVEGIVAHDVDQADIQVRNKLITYTDLLMIRALDKAFFSVPGDSGALVFTADKRPFGMIVGSSDKKPFSYVVRLSKLLSHDKFQPFLHTFFQ